MKGLISAVLVVAGILAGGFLFARGLMSAIGPTDEERVVQYLAEIEEAQKDIRASSAIQFEYNPDATAHHNAVCEAGLTWSKAFHEYKLVAAEYRLAKVLKEPRSQLDVYHQRRDDKAAEKEDAWDRQLELGRTPEMKEIKRFFEEEYALVRTDGKVVECTRPNYYAIVPDGYPYTN